MPAQARIESELDAVCAGVDAGVAKLVLTRGVGSRGYASAEPGGATLVLSTHPMPPAYPEAGLNLRWAELKLALQPALAGLKHLNRLEQVLIRREWSDPMIHEALCCDSDGQVRCALSANVFVHRNGVWTTPPVQRAGVAGITRGWLLESRSDIRVEDLHPDAVMQADAIFLCNAVRGILPVRSLAERSFDDHDAIHELQALWALSST
jgi:4-amino-4-deoxychorismate lyase